MQIPWFYESIHVIRGLDQPDVEVTGKRRVLGKWVDVDASQLKSEPRFAVLIIPDQACETWSSAVDSQDSDDIMDQIQFEVQQHVSGDPQEWLITHRMDTQDLHFCAIRKEDEQRLRDRAIDLGYNVIACVSDWSDQVLESDLESLNVADSDSTKPNRDLRDKSLVLNTILAIGAVILLGLTGLQMATYGLGNQLVRLEDSLRSQEKILLQLDQSRADLAKDQQGLELVRSFINSPTPVTRIFQGISGAIPSDTWLLQLTLSRTETSYDMVLRAASEQRNAAISAMDRLSQTRFQNVRLDMTERVQDRETTRFTELSGRNVYRFTIQSDWP